MTATAESVQSSVSPRTSYISDIGEKNGTMHFTLARVNVSIANAIRRTILADIPTLAFKVFPHAQSQVKIRRNTSRFNNEILKQRLGCVPIHIQDLTLPFDELLIELEIENTTKEVIHVTSADFKIKNTRTDKYLTETATQKIFPPDPLTGDFILLARLRPQISGEVPGEAIYLEAAMSLQTAAADGMYNVASCCSYGMSPDKLQQDRVWQARLAELTEEDREAESLVLIKQDWYNHEAKRIFKPGHYDFVIESVGVFSNRIILHKACEILISRLDGLLEEGAYKVSAGVSTMPLCYDIRLEAMGYTLGKLIEAMLHESFYQAAKDLTYVAFTKAHPDDTYSTIRLALVEGEEETTAMAQQDKVNDMLKAACGKGKAILAGIIEDLG